MRGVRGKRGTRLPESWDDVRDATTRALFPKYIALHRKHDGIFELETKVTAANDVAFMLSRRYLCTPPFYLQPPHINTQGCALPGAMVERSCPGRDETTRAEQQKFALTTAAAVQSRCKIIRLLSGRFTLGRVLPAYSPNGKQRETFAQGRHSDILREKSRHGHGGRDGSRRPRDVPSGLQGTFGAVPGMPHEELEGLG